MGDQPLGAPPVLIGHSAPPTPTKIYAMALYHSTLHSPRRRSHMATNLLKEFLCFAK